MHAPGYRWTILLVGIAAFTTIGCRGSKPFGRFVQVTQDPDTEALGVEPPRQRLAVSSPRSDVEVTVSTEDDRSPHVERLSSSRTRANSPSNSAAQAPTVAYEAEAAKFKRENEARENSRRSITRRPMSPSEPASTAPRAVASNDPASPISSNMVSATKENADLMAAFSDYPPEVQQEALRRLVAATARSAEKTSQPDSLSGALTRNLNDLPVLPPADEIRPDRSPTRLASSEQRESNRRSAAESNSPESNSPEPSAVAALRELPRDNEGVEIDSAPSKTAVAQVNDSQTEKSSPAVVQMNVEEVTATPAAVKTVSASRENDEPSKVARASVATQDEMTVPAKVQGMLEPESSVLDEKSLYSTLVKRLSKAPAGESESERATRLIKLRHLMVLSGDLDSAVEQIEGMSESEQEFLRHQLLGLWTMVDPDGHPMPSRRITTALPQLREATKFAAAATDSLEVRSLSFCTEIESYGQIKPFKGNRFDSGQQVILYCEIENFTANKGVDGYETHLQGSYDVYNAKNEKVVSQLLPADKQVSTNYLRDYFIAYQMHLPAQLTPGTYRLQLTMEDVNGKKYGQSSIPFELAK